jgi:hydrogenase maturation protease
MTLASRSSSVLVLGLGNPILGDDGVGWRVASEVKERTREINPPIEVDWASFGGLRLMERMLGYQRVILIDAAQTGQHPIGAVHLCALEDLADPMLGHTASAHDASLGISLRMADAMGEVVPSRVEVLTVEIPSALEFSEELTPQVAASIPLAIRKALELLT